MSQPALKTEAAKPAIFIDGEAGTTGLGIRERLAEMHDVEVKSIDPVLRKDPKARQAMMEAVDLVVLCLPDEASRETVALADELGNRAPRIIDASTAYRVAPGWVYGFPELTADQSSKIANAERVANPGCYPTGALALLRPLVDAGVMSADYPVTINAISGFSGGGKSMIEAWESGKSPQFELYGLGLQHKHVPETQMHSGLTRRPIFVPSVGHFKQGMLVSVPLHLAMLKGASSSNDLRKLLADRYAGSRFVMVASEEETAALGNKLEPQALNGSNRLELFVFGNDAHGHAILVARLDNLGKGAAGAAVQNLRLMLGLGEHIV